MAFGLHDWALIAMFVGGAFTGLGGLTFITMSQSAEFMRGQPEGTNAMRLSRLPLRRGVRIVVAVGLVLLFAGYIVQLFPPEKA